jgi:hypothetical protein
MATLRRDSTLGKLSTSKNPTRVCVVIVLVVSINLKLCKSLARCCPRCYRIIFSRYLGLVLAEKMVLACIVPAFD